MILSSFHFGKKKKGEGPVPSAQSGVETNDFLNAALRHSHECCQTKADLLAESNRTMYCHHR
jgi:hypothetical protein